MSERPFVEVADFLRAVEDERGRLVDGRRDRMGVVQTTGTLNELGGGFHGSSLQPDGGRLTAIGAVDRFGLFGPGPDDRFDEQAVGVLVAAVQKLAHRLEAVGALVVNAGEIQRRQRIVAGTDEEEAGKPAGELIQGITKRGGLECRQLFAGATAHIGASGAQLVGTSRTRRGGDEDDLLCPGVCRLFEQAAQRIGTITQAVRFAAPRPLGAEPDQVRLGGDRDRQRCRASASIR